MKLKFLSITCATVLFIFFIDAHAQNLAPKLNQLKLMEDLWVGECQLHISKDSLIVSDLIQYGNVFVYNAYLVVDGKKYFRFGGSYVFSLKEDKFKGFAFTPNGNYQTWIGSFVTETKMSMDMVQNFNPEKVLYKEVVEWENPTNYNVTFFDLNGIKTGGSKWTRRAK